MVDCEVWSVVPEVMTTVEGAVDAPGEDSRINGAQKYQLYHPKSPARRSRLL